MHDHPHDRTTRNIRTAFFLNFGFALLEIVGGLLTNSVAILSDAVHDLGDSLSLGSAWFLERYATKQRDTRYSYGYRRFSVLGSLLNATVLIIGGVFILNEAIPRLLHPEQAHAEGMIGFALVGILVNGLAALRLRSDKSLNAKVVAWHLFEDVLGWGAVLIVAIVLLFTDWYILDPILSMAITGYVLFNAFRYLRKTFRVFLQAVPEETNIDELEERIRGLDGVLGVHHTHVWSLDGERHVLTTHVVVDCAADLDRIAAIRGRVEAVARESGLWHTTVQVEREADDCNGC